MQKFFQLIQTNHIAWMSKVGVAVPETDSPIGQSHKVDFLVGGDRGPVPLSNTKHPKSGDPSIWGHKQKSSFWSFTAYSTRKPVISAFKVWIYESKS